MKWKPGVVSVLIISAFGMHAQTSASAPAPVSKADASSPDAPKVATDGGKPSIKPYVVGPLDLLDIRVWNDQKLSGLYPVRPDGIISMPLLGEIKADGLTVPELTKFIRDKIAASLTNDPPDVNINPARINSQRIFILGAANRPGEMQLTGEMRILDVISNCGLRDFAKPTKIYVLRGEKKFYFNYKDVIKGKHMEQNILLENGDHLVIPGD